MKVYTLDIDSGEREPLVYPNQNDYTMYLVNTIYEIKRIKLVSAKIPYTQLLINETNNRFTVNDDEYTLPIKNYSNGYELASALETTLSTPTSNISSVVFQEDTNSLLFSNIGTSNTFSINFYSGVNGFTSYTSDKTTPHQVLGFNSLDYHSENGQITSGSINLQGPNDILLRIGSGSEFFNKHIHTGTPFYTGRILRNENATIYSSADDPFEHIFHKGSEHRNVSHLIFKFFYMSHGRLIPYDFRNQDHVLKLEIECSLERNEARGDIPIKTFALPPPISIPELKNPYKWKEYIYICLIIIVGSLLMFMVKRKQPIASPRKLVEPVSTPAWTSEK